MFLSEYVEGSSNNQALEIYNPGVPFEPSVEWDGFAVDTFGGLHSHTAACAPVVPALPPLGLVGLAALLCLTFARMARSPAPACH